MIMMRKRGGVGGREGADYDENNLFGYTYIKEESITSLYVCSKCCNELKMDTMYHQNIS